MLNSMTRSSFPNLNQVIFLVLLCLYISCSFLYSPLDNSFSLHAFSATENISLNTSIFCSKILLSLIILVTNTDSVHAIVVQICIDGNHEHSQGKWVKSHFFHHQNFLFPITLVYQFLNISNFPNHQNEYD